METKFNFNSQVCTSKVQSERLLALGLKKETADMALVPLMEWDDCTAQEYFTGIYVARTKEDVERYGLDYITAWSLGRLIEMLPSSIYPKEELPSFSGCAYLNLAQIAVWYDYTDYDMDDRTLISWSGNGFFLAVVNCIEWLIKEGYFNKEYLCE